MSYYLDWSLLPDDCLLLIHQKLQNSGDRNAFGLTCKKWLNIQNIGRKFLVFDFTYNTKAYQECPRYLLRLLSRFPYLNSLSLAGCTELPDSALNPLTLCSSSLKYLSLYSCFSITDNGLAVVSTGCPKLETLNLYRCNITDTGLEYLARSCHNLKNISLSNCFRVSDHGISALCKGCPKLCALIISSCKGITGIGFKDSPITLTYLEADCCHLTPEGILQSVSGGGLEYLNLSHPKNFSGNSDGLFGIGSGYAQKLRFLNLRLCRHMSDNSATAIAKGCPLLEEWNLAVCHGVSIVGWSAIGVNCKRLRVLHINRCRNLCNRGLQALREGCCRLEVLYIHGCKRVTNVGLELFRMLRHNVALRREEHVSMSIGPCIDRFFL